MRDFPKINDKFYGVGQKCTTLRRTIETMASIYEAAENQSRDPAMGFPDRDVVESNSFSVMVGFIDGALARITRR